MSMLCTRRIWLTNTANAGALLLAAVPFRHMPNLSRRQRRFAPSDPAATAQVAPHAWQSGADLPQMLVQQALDAARGAGARYADVRLTRRVGHGYRMQSHAYEFAEETERIGIGVRTLVDNAWGFASGTVWKTDAVVGLARDAVAQATINAKVYTVGRGGAGSEVELGNIPVATGHWTTPIAIDPFRVSVEEKLDLLQYWNEFAWEHRLFFPAIFPCRIECIRQECVLGTSEGTLVTQTTYVTGGGITVTEVTDRPDPRGAQLAGIGHVGRGWEAILDAKIPEQLLKIQDRWAHEETPRPSKLPPVGKYTLVCDGATMASMLDTTLGIATQLDRALGYEANAQGTSFLDDPLAMLGHAQIAAPLITVSANRSAPEQLATIMWDDEGVVPQPFTLVKHGVLVDFQTTREQAAWLAPYYQQRGSAVASHGCAAAEDALMAPLQMMPNLALEPSTAQAHLDDLIANVAHGILVTGGTAQCDFQGRTGTLSGSMREIRNGRLGADLVSSVVRFNTTHFWKHIIALGGPSTVDRVSNCDTGPMFWGGYGLQKGEPSQGTYYTVQGAAATIVDQAVIRS